MKKRIIAVLAGVLIIASVITFGMVFSVREVTEVYEDGSTATKGGDIAAIAGIFPGDNILGINETTAIRRVSDAFPDNSIDIGDIERVFPNKVIIKIKQRLPLVALPCEGGGYALADIDFRLNKKLQDGDAELLSVILAEGIFIKDSFNTPEAKRLREALIAAKSAGFDDRGLAAFIASISLSAQDSVIFTLRSGGVITCTGFGESLINEFSSKYALYLTLSDIERSNANL